MGTARARLVALWNALIDLVTSLTAPRFASHLNCAPRLLRCDYPAGYHPAFSAPMRGGCPDCFVPPSYARSGRGSPRPLCWACWLPGLRRDEGVEFDVS